jgi:hypothetical protein
VTAPEDETLNDTAGPPALAAAAAHLFVALECERPFAGSTRHSLAGMTEVHLGRGADRAATRRGAALSIEVPSRWMSGAHARLRRDGFRWVLEDAGSRNGTRVNGKPVVHWALADQDVIEVGHTLLVFRDPLPAPPGAPPDVDSARAKFPAAGLATVLPGPASDIDALARIAASEVPVLLRGETGTGKEITARAVHALSGRAGPFVAVNCAALPEALLESLLFGHVKGAFSGAIRDEAGLVRAAQGGTLFLDEIGDLRPASQAALLRVLQEREVVPVGATRNVAVDVRVVSATHQPLASLADRGAFRNDLLARLDGFTFEIPPLRQRREDLGLLLASLAEPDDRSRRKLSPEAGRALLAYDWPRNVRELAHCLARARALAAEGDTLELAHLPAPLRQAAPSAADDKDAAAPEARLRAQLESLLQEHAGNVAEVGRALGKGRMQIHRWLKRLGVDPRRYRV